MSRITRAIRHSLTQYPITGPPSEDPNTSSLDAHPIITLLRRALKFSCYSCACCSSFMFLGGVILILVGLTKDAQRRESENDNSHSAIFESCVGYRETQWDGGIMGPRNVHVTASTCFGQRRSTSTYANAYLRGNEHLSVYNASLDATCMRGLAYWMQFDSQMTHGVSMHDLHWEVSCDASYVVGEVLLDVPSGAWRHSTVHFDGSIQTVREMQFDELRVNGGKDLRMEQNSMRTAYIEANTLRWYSGSVTQNLTINTSRVVRLVSQDTPWVRIITSQFAGDVQNVSHYHLEVPRKLTTDLDATLTPKIFLEFKALPSGNFTIRTHSDATLPIIINGTSADQLHYEINTDNLRRGWIGSPSGPDEIIVECNDSTCDVEVIFS